MASSTKRFHFFDLPIDLQLQILGSDPCSTLSLIHASKRAKSLFVHNSQSIICALLRQWPCQLRYLIQTIIAARQHLVTTPGVAPVQSLHESWLEPIPGHPPNIKYPAITTLHLLQTLSLELDLLCSLFVHRALVMAAKIFTAPEINNRSDVSPQLSEEELYRIKRAFLRLLLYSELFNQPSTQMILLEREHVVSLFHKLCPWELEELMTIFDFSYAVILGMSSPSTRAPDQLQLYNQVHTSQPNFQSHPQPFLLRIVPTLLTLLQTPPDPSTPYKQHPTTTWNDAPPGANARSYGSLYCDPVLSSSGSSAFPIRRDLRHFGFSIWNEERLSSWQDLPPSRDPGEGYVDLEGWLLLDWGLSWNEEIADLSREYSNFWERDGLHDGIEQNIGRSVVLE